MSSADALSERERRVLEAVIHTYIETAEPAGSQTIARRYPLGLSAASIRSIMSDLETKGFLFHTHTSAGRIPTDRAYRLYVNDLMRFAPPSDHERETLRRELGPDRSAIEEILRRAAQVLGVLTHELGVAAAPRLDAVVLDRLDLVLIPEIFWDFCHPEVMVMQRMNGVPISQIERMRDAGVDIPKLARDGVTIFFTQVFRDGFFHADMHPGNIQVSLDPATFGRYISLDFGIVGTLTESDKEYLAQNFVAFFRRDYKRVAELHIESGWVPPETRVNDLESAIRAVCEPYFDRPLKEISLGMVLMRLFQTSRRFHVEIQPQLVLLQKTLLNIEGLGRELDPELDLWSTAKPFLEKWMLEQMGPQRLWRELRAEAPHYAKLIPELPRLLHDALRQRPADQQQALRELLEVQHRTNRLLQSIIYGGVGFVLGLLAMQLFVRMRIF